MQKTIITCDHCGKEVPDTYEGRFDAFFMNAATAPGINACSREHLGFALAKAFGIPIDGSAADLQKRNEELARAVQSSGVRLLNAESEIRRLSELPDEFTRWVQEDLHRAIGEAPHTYDRVELLGVIADMVAELKELKAQQAPVVDGKTPGQVAHDAWHDTPTGDLWEAAAQAVLRTFGGAEVLRRVMDKCRSMNGYPNSIHVDDFYRACCDELANLGAQDITDPSKPTKPLAILGTGENSTHTIPLATACVGCGGTGVDLNQHCCFECGGKGYLP